MDKQNHSTRRGAMFRHTASAARGRGKVGAAAFAWHRAAAMQIVLFEDRPAAQLQPITLGRAAFDISLGSYRLRELVGKLGVSLSWIVRPHLRGVLEADCGPPPPLDCRHGLLLVNACALPGPGTLQTLRTLLDQGQPGMVRAEEDRVAAVVLPPGSATPPAEVEELEAFFAGLSLLELPHQLRLLSWPHEVIREHTNLIGPNLELRIATGNYREIAEGVFVGPDVQLGAYVVTDSRRGPIVLERGASVGPYTLLAGPLYLGERARVLEHAAIKDGVSAGHMTKIGGEVEASAIEPFTNKQHHGFLGHSYLGSWINLGAGTCNSDLKNTYGQVNMKYAGRKMATGMQFVGCIMGDYAKTAINTSIFTGKRIGACSMLYGFVTTDVPSFVNYGRSFGQMTELPVAVMEAVQARMFARRDVPQRRCDVQLLHDMYALTQAERMAELSSAR